MGQHEALVHCITGAPWNPVDHLANVHEAILIRETADADPSRVWTFNVEHWRMQDRTWATVDAALLPDSHGAVRVTVLHADVDPRTRKCQACGTVVGSGRVGELDWLSAWAQPQGLERLMPLGALPT